MKPSDLASHACVVFLAQSGEARWHFANSDGEHSVTVAGRLCVNSTEAATKAVRDGVGIGVLPDYAVHGWPLVKIDEAAWRWAMPFSARLPMRQYGCSKITSTSSCV